MTGAAAGIGAGIGLWKQNRDRKKAIKEEERLAMQDQQQAGSEQRAFEQSMVSTGQDKGYNIGNSMTNSYLPGYQMAQAGGLRAATGPGQEQAQASPNNQ